jgi:hypothetical protein
LGRVPQIGLAVASCLALLACSPNPAAPLGQGEPDQILYGVRHSLMWDGLVRSRIDADSVHLFSERGAVRLHGVRAVLLSPTLEEVVRVSADQADLELAGHVMRVRGHVELSTTDLARRIETEEGEVEIDLHANTVNVSGPSRMLESSSARELDSFRGDLRLRSLPAP